MLRDFRMLRQLCGLGAALVIFTRAPGSLAQTDEQRAAARSLATEGATAFSEARWKDAVDRFTRAEALVHAPPHLLFLARSHEKLGQLVKAREAYLKITKEQLPANAPQVFRDARVAAEQELRSIEPRIANLSIKVQGPAETANVSVLVDGVPLPSVLIGVSRPVDPGEHRIEALANGFRSKTETVRVTEGERRAVTVTLVADPTAPPAPAVAPGSPPSSPISPPSSAAAAPGVMSSQSGAATDSTSGLRIGSYVALGVGAVGLGLGTYFLLDSRGKRSDADAAYEDCSARADCRENDESARRTRELDDDARSSLTVSIVGFSVGAVGLAVGTALLVVSSGSSEERPPTGLLVKPFLGFGSAGVVGTF